MIELSWADPLLYLLGTLAALGVLAFWGLVFAIAGRSLVRALRGLRWTQRGQR